MMPPIVASPFAETVPTWAIASPLTGFERRRISSVARSTALSMPRFRAIGLAPAATVFTPSRKIACAKTVAVVVPSPATSEVLEATSRTICAPMFSRLSFSSISFATVTPSLVIAGLHIQSLAGAVLAILAFADCYDFAFLWLLFSGIRDDDPSANLFAFFNSPQNDAVVKRPDVYCHNFCLAPLKLGVLDINLLK